MKQIVLSIFCLCLVSCHKAPEPSGKAVDVILVGAGIMSATLGSMLAELDPDISIEIFETLNGVAEESSSAWNNAGTGHAALCELNYTPEKADGSIDIKRAIEIHEAFEISKQYWAYLVEQKKIAPPQAFVHRVPHMSFVWGDQNVAFLKKRYETLTQHPFFEGMQYSDDREQIDKWLPLIMADRNKDEKVAATRMEVGTDVDFGALSRALIEGMLKSPNTKLHLHHKVTDLKRNDDSTWTVVVTDLQEKKSRSFKAKFVFIGAGGAALTLLQKSGIPEAKGYGGFPVGGQWLATDKPELVERHFAKVYGKASLGSPPMSVPHLDTRYVNGKKALLFGPFATFSTKFLKNGSWVDLPSSITLKNVVPMMEAGWDNLPLTQYLISQVLMTPEERLAELRRYIPNVRMEDWRLENAGQRVQTIKDDPVRGGILQFGTELVASEDGSIVALLGASPGASIAVQIMLGLLEESFQSKLATTAWLSKLREMIPSYGRSLAQEPALYKKIKDWDEKLLGLND